jgi:uncharacterized membrane-anchored protein YhcB (DUF1043 family)
MDSETAMWAAIGAIIGLIIGAVLVYVLMNFNGNKTFLTYDSEGRIASIIEK